MRLITVSKEKFNDSRFEKIFVIKRTRSVIDDIEGRRKYSILFIFARASSSFVPSFLFREGNKLTARFWTPKRNRIFVDESDELLIEIIRLQKGSKRGSWKDLNGNSLESFGRISFELWTGDYEFYSIRVRVEMLKF